MYRTARTKTRKKKKNQPDAGYDLPKHKSPMRERERSRPYKQRQRRKEKSQYEEKPIDKGKNTLAGVPLRTHHEIRIPHLCMHPKKIKHRNAVIPPETCSL
jgi:hypothetical protein